jgi:hypothetical protein
MSRRAPPAIFLTLTCPRCARASFPQVVVKRIDDSTIAGHFDDSFMMSWCLSEAQTSSMADYWAIRFNRECERRGVLAVPPGAQDDTKQAVNLRFLPAYVLDLEGVEETLGMEPYLRGAYIKHNDNDGYISNKGHRGTDVAMAFSYFTYVASDEELLVCDIQGVGQWFTDPQIHTASGGNFGMGNMGPEGIEAFLKTHRNNSICEVSRAKRSAPWCENLNLQDRVAPRSRAGTRPSQVRLRARGRLGGGRAFGSGGFETR